MDSKREKGKREKGKRPFAKSDFEAVLKSATKPLKKQDEKESEGTSASHHSDDSSGKHKS